MNQADQHLERLISNAKLEFNAQEERYNSSGRSYTDLKNEGLLLHPIQVKKRQFGFADYPEFSFHLPFQFETSQFRDGAKIQLILENETPIDGILIQLNGAHGEIRLLSPDFPDWLNEKGVAVRIQVDQRTNEIMLDALHQLKDTPYWKLFESLHTNSVSNAINENLNEEHLDFKVDLNESQKKAITACLTNKSLQIIHGPPGTGKTTTLIELTHQLIKKKKRILISAPSNAAIDHIGKQLKKYEISFLRAGNASKVDDLLTEFTLDGWLSRQNIASTIKKLRIQAEQLRKMATQYKRNFGKEERDQRRLLLQEVKSIRKEIKLIRAAGIESIFDEVDVIIGTPIGLNDLNIQHIFDYVILDEAGQCLEPLAWIVLSKANHAILAGDPFQLPPTVISDEASRNGFNISILELAMKSAHPIHFLDTQYRMKSSIAEFSNRYFYEGNLKTHNSIIENEVNIHFYDTAGADYIELKNQDTSSISNKEELNALLHLVEKESLPLDQTSFITPYSGQLMLANELLPNGIRKSTIDSFQGQEAPIILLSLVRSNKDQIIGFLADYRRMNVALTRAKKRLYIIGDSTTIGNDSFYNQLLDYIEKINGYHSVFELVY